MNNATNDAHGVDANGTPPTLRIISTLANLSIALTTPINAPPAIKPDAMSVPLLLRALLSTSSLLRVLTYHEIAPPINKGILRSIGMNIPSANGSAGILAKVSINAITAPMPYNNHGALPPDIIGSMTADIAFACGATNEPSPTKP